MQKKYTKTEMYRVIELWQESKPPQKEFCKLEKIGFHAFKYWYRKYKEENGLVKVAAMKGSNNEFIPLEIPALTNPVICNPDQIEVLFPNGIQLSCPVDMDIEKLKTLLGA